jgi:virulence-associated protein VapD
MSQYARNNPELYEQGIDWLDAHSDLADMEKFEEKGFKKVDGSIYREVDEKIERLTDEMERAETNEEREGEEF